MFDSNRFQVGVISIDAETAAAADDDDFVDGDNFDKFDFQWMVFLAEYLFNWDVGHL